jgi:hypothetical protein
MTHDAGYHFARQASDLARLLEQASPDKAFEFALGMHERACRGIDQAWTDLWLEVVTILKNSGQAAAPSSAVLEAPATSAAAPESAVGAVLSGPKPIGPLPVVPPPEPGNMQAGWDVVLRQLVSGASERAPVRPAASDGL